MEGKSRKKRKIIEHIPPELKEPKFVNTFKVGFSKGSFCIDFGRFRPSEETQEVDVLSRIVMPSDNAFELVKALLSAIVGYEKEFKEELIPKDVKK
ncbi:MAG: DUF3467 domain-containing protein [Bacillota bacterium]